MSPVRMTVPRVITAGIAAGLGTTAGQAHADTFYLDTGAFFNIHDEVGLDGVPDSGPWDFSFVMNAPEGETRAIAEVDIGSFEIPDGHAIVYAAFETVVWTNFVWGLGLEPGTLPGSVSAYGYSGDGVVSMGDYSSGDGNLINTVATGSIEVGNVVSFEATAFIAGLIADGADYAGFNIRADTIGGLSLNGEGSDFPRMVIVTVAVPAPGVLGLAGLGGLVAARRRR